MKGTLFRHTEDWHYDRRSGRDADPASTPLQLDIREGDVHIQELRAPDLLEDTEEDEEEDSEFDMAGEEVLSDWA
jgi:hypothetical protein